MGSWKAMIDRILDRHGETWKDVVHSTLSRRELKRYFDSSFGATEGKPFTLWTVNRVYFPVCYDGAEWVASVPRNPCDEITEHIGGG